MRVLVLESRSGAADDPVVQLQARGHSVVRCHDGRGRRVFPCSALVEGHQCPLENHRPRVDVALTVRHQASSLPAPLEDGIACALRAHVPVVVAGDVESNPYEALGAAVAGDDVVKACERAANKALERRGSVALRVPDAALGGHDTMIDINIDRV